MHHTLLNLRFRAVSRVSSTSAAAVTEHTGRQTHILALIRGIICRQRLCLWQGRKRDFSSSDAAAAVAAENFVPFPFTSFTFSLCQK